MKELRKFFALNTHILKDLCILMFIFTVGLGALFLVHCIPDQYMKKNIRASMDELEKEDHYPKIIFDKYSWMLDMWSEDAFLDMLYNSDSTRPIYSALSNAEGHGSTPLERLHNDIYDLTKTEEINSRPLYWLGFKVFIIPLLSLFSYSVVRIIFAVIHALIFLWAIYVLFKKEKALAVVLAAVYLYTNCWMTWFQVVFGAFCIDIALFAVMYIYYKFVNMNNKEIDGCDWLKTFLIIGALTSFFDWWTCPLVSFGWPVAVLLYFNYKHSNKSDFSQNFNLLFRCGIGWLSGFGAMLLFRIIACFVFLEKDEAAWALTHASTYITAVPIKGYIKSQLKGLMFSLPTNFLPYSVSIPLDFVLFVTLIIFIWRNRQVKEMYIFLIIAFIPVAWFTVFARYALLHYWILYRIYSVSHICIGICILISLSESKRAYLKEVLVNIFGRK